MLDSRRHLLAKIVGKKLKISVHTQLFKFFAALAVALIIAYVPDYGTLSDKGNHTLFILIFAAGLWSTEAIPAFAVSLLVVALEIMVLGFNNFDFADRSADWKVFLTPWSSPLIFLFLAGFIMAVATSKTKLDLWLAKKVLFFVGTKPENIMTGLIIITFVLSMFISNTATTAMMLAVLFPILKSMKDDNPFQKAILLGVAMAANMGGMGTIIGSPPNAIAIGILGENAPSFLGWMIYALPPAIVITVLLRLFLMKIYPSTETEIDLSGLEDVCHKDDSTDLEDKEALKVPNVPSWKKMTVIVVFAATIGLWLSAPIHHIPTTVVSFLPIIVFTMVGIIDVDDIRELRWDVLILIFGGLSLGLAVAKTGLATWFAGMFDVAGASILIITAIFAYVIVMVSNFMSNTAATNIMLPIVIAIVATMGSEASTVAIVAIALSASLAMALPVSTPPNAIVYAGGSINASDFLKLGIAAGIIGPVMILIWFQIM